MSMMRGGRQSSCLRCCHCESSPSSFDEYSLGATGPPSQLLAILGSEAASRLLPSAATITIFDYYLARKLILPSSGW